jgi:N utilization substance protein A
MPSELSQLIEQVGKDKGIQQDILVEALESAMLSAARKKLGTQKNLEAHYNDDLGEVEVFQFKDVVEKIKDFENELSIEDAKELDIEAEYGDSLGIKIETETFGRIAAQTAKQVIIQKIKEAEGENIYNEYKDKVGQLVNGVVQRFERKNVIVNLGRAEAVLLYREQIPRESFFQGDRVRAMILDVKMENRGPEIILTRVDPQFIIKLFEVEVPEVYDGIIKIMGAAREAGKRAKIAVATEDPDVDPVGACVGVKGSRVQSVVKELRGEKIDIIHYSPDIARYVCNALAPAEVSKVIIDEINRTMEVIVSDDQPSLAIGKGGINIRLASKLVDWKIEVKNKAQDEETRREITALIDEAIRKELEKSPLASKETASGTVLSKEQDSLEEKAEPSKSASGASGLSVEVLPGVGDKTSEILKNNGYEKIGDLKNLAIKDLENIEGIGPKKAKKIFDTVWTFINMDSPKAENP